METNRTPLSFEEVKNIVNDTDYPIKEVYGLLLVHLDEPEKSTVDNYTTLEEAQAKLEEWYNQDKHDRYCTNVKMHGNSWYEYTRSGKKTVVCINKSHIWTKH